MYIFNTGMEVEERSAAIGALSLTAREIEYISLAAIGFKNIEIADILSVTNSTVFGNRFF